MNKILFLVFVIFFAGCSHKKISVSQKAFDKEDVYIVYALRSEEIGNYSTAAMLYEKMFNKSSKKEYLYKSVKDYMYAKEFDKALDISDRYLEENPDDNELLRLKILSLIHLKKYEKAKKFAKELVKKTKKSDDYIIVADIYLKQKQYDMAIKYLDSAYSKNYDEKILDKISIILYLNMQKQKEAIARLETHSRMFGCSYLICNRLASFYSQQNNIDGLLSVYKRFYKFHPSKDVLDKIIKIYLYKKDYISLAEFLEKTKANDEILFEIYTSLKNYKKAYKLGYRLYEKTGNIDYFANATLFEYESTSKKDKKFLKKIVNNLKKVIKEDNDPLYLNYLGYLLIDHNLNVKEGIRYVKKALKKKPNSAYYLDSLAWGYYKLGKCKKANQLFNKIRKLKDGNDKEILKHIKQVNKCLKRNKKV